MDFTGWPRSALEGNRFTLLNEVILDLQVYGVHPGKTQEILCTTVHSYQIVMYNRTECTKYYVQPYRGGTNQ